MTHKKVGIIGGTGLGDSLIKEAGGRPAEVETPFGRPSIAPIEANWEGVDVVFLARHGESHRYNPSTVPYRANIWALKKLGVSAILASGATGSLREDFEPGQLVLCDQVIDRTVRRESTFFDHGLVAHVEFGEPFCPSLRKLLIAAGENIEETVHHAGTYVCMEGPQFSTRAESLLHRQWGGDLIGMTCMPEAKLAREAEICYALIAFPTDYDCWRPADPGRPQEALLNEILGNLRRATDNAVKLIRETLKLWKQLESGCRCPQALEMAIWSDKSRIEPASLERLDLLIAKRVTR